MGYTGPVIEAVDLTKRYGSFVALDRLSLAVGPGEILGFIGPNGAGKTTTIKILVGLARPSAGAARVAGVDCAADPRRVKRLLGYMPDTFGGYDNMRVGEYLDFFGAAFGLPRRARAARVDEVLDLAGARGFKDLFVEALSHGMKQRVAVARTLLHDPPALILDEPANGLDPRARIELRQMINGLAARGKTVLVSSHILTELGEMCDQVGIIERGQLLAVGGVENIRSQQQQAQMSIAVRPLGDPAPLAEFLTGQEQVSAVRAGQGEVHLMFAGDAAAQAALLQRVIAAGFAVVEFRAKPVSLEDVFMKVTTGAVQ